MTDLKAFLLQLNNNLNILQEREAKYANNALLICAIRLKTTEKALA